MVSNEEHGYTEKTQEFRRTASHVGDFSFTRLAESPLELEKESFILRQSLHRVSCGPDVLS